MDTMQDESFERAISTDQYNRPLKTVRVWSWLVLFVSIAFGVEVILWACFGIIPVTVSGKCLVYDPKNVITIKSPLSGTVVKVHKIGGAKLEKGDPLVTVVTDGGPVEIRAPLDGSMIWMELASDETVSIGETVGYIETPVTPKDLLILGFFELIPANSIQPGMQVKCALDSVDTGRYGMLMGTVKQIFPYPISRNEYYMRKIPSEGMKRYLWSEENPTILVIIEPTLDEHTPSGLAWTSKIGPPHELRPSSVGVARVILEEIRPIAYVIPSLRKNDG